MDRRSKLLVVVMTMMLLLMLLSYGQQTNVPVGNVLPVAVSQSSVLQNTEQVSGTNAAVTKSVAAVGGQRVHLYSASARCSAGTAQLQVKDGVAGTVIWSTAATEVGTTTFSRSWAIPLATTTGNGLDVVLGACGVSNTGTLSVQASQF